MPSAFNFSASPFDCLSPQEQRQVRSQVDIAYFQPGETILDKGAVPSHLFIVIKGFVQQLDEGELLNTAGPDDCFDGRGLVAGRVSSRFVAAEEVLVYQLPKDCVSELIASNVTFGALLFSDLSNKLSAIAARQSQHQLQSLSMARVDQAFVRRAHFVDASTDIVSVARLFQTERSTNVLVRDSQSVPPRIGIFTATALQRAILHGTPLAQLEVGLFANFELVTVRPSDTLGDALATMLHHNVHRVVVREGERIDGILETLDLFSFLSNHSYLISLQIRNAQSLDTLRTAAQQITQLITLLYRGGTRLSLIATLVQELNSRLFERAWQLIAPPDLIANSCLFVMGSEGRGEQLLKTDQDNALVLRDGYVCSGDLDAICQRFSAALGDFGYPPCPGNIMLSNPAWCQSAQAFGALVRDWLLQPTPAGLMSLAIFLDARAVCGDARLLEQLRRKVQLLANDNAIVLGRFAAASNAFGDSGSWWSRLLSRSEADSPLDIKKAAIFPLVHGIRSLALAHGQLDTSSAARVQALVACGALPAALGTDLLASLHFFMGLRLQAGLAEMDSGRTVSGQIDGRQLSSLERDLLNDTLSVVKRFKLLLRQRFHLDAL